MNIADLRQGDLQVEAHMVTFGQGAASNAPLCVCSTFMVDLILCQLLLVQVSVNLGAVLVLRQQTRNGDCVSYDAKSYDHDNDIGAGI